MSPNRNKKLKINTPETDYKLPSFTSSSPSVQGNVGILECGKVFPSPEYNIPVNKCIRLILKSGKKGW